MKSDSNSNNGGVIRGALPLKIKLGYGLGDIGSNLFIVTTGMFLLYFMVEVMGIDPALAGTALLFPKLWDVVSDPIMGTISDATRSKHGRRRPYLLYGSVPFGLTFLILFIAPHYASEMANTIHVALLFALGCTAFTVINVPYSSMVAEMSDNYNERMSITAFRMSSASVGALIAGGAAMPLVKLGGGGETGFVFMAEVFSVLIIISCLICFYSTKRAPALPPKEDTPPIFEQIRIAFKNFQFFMLMSSYFFQALAVGVMMAGFVFFIKYVMGQTEESMGIAFPIFLVTGILFIPVWNAVGKRFGKIRSYYIGLAIFTVMQLSLFFSKPDLIVFFYIQIFILGIGFSSFQLFPFSMLPDTIEYDQMRSGMRREGVFSGMWSSGQKIAYSVGPPIVGLVLAAFHYDKSLEYNQPDSVALGVRLVFCVFPAAMIFLSFIPFSRYGLTEKKFEEIKKVIAKEGGS
ncbi:MAG: MFS transporter [Deltaproteobacteria bacterium]|uniref:MFS transporter n=1 Tax=Candidatus Zymogenus saltonus TaxID=2844893 RepID=A0A9D8PN37_9DELT|nr:MFS transporter [Candidatus Zymogenus saltonus]